MLGARVLGGLPVSISVLVFVNKWIKIERLLEPR